MSKTLLIERHWQTSSGTQLSVSRWQTLHQAAVSKPFLVSLTISLCVDFERQYVNSASPGQLSSNVQINEKDPIAKKDEKDEKHGFYL